MNGTLPIRAGQRWSSETEPELGLGIVLKVLGAQVTIRFPAAGDSRQYSLETAPLRRVRFGPGDRVQPRTGESFVVEAVVERDGLLVYAGANGELVESELSDVLGETRPQDLLLRGQADGPALFDLRYRARVMQHWRDQSPLRGFLGGRIALIPHQLFIAREVARRHAPRVLLADEVGLGKTIEACLILHRLLVSGRIERVLILAPESLVHQWFVELLRRFNFWFRIFNESRCVAIEGGDPGANPFAEDELVLCSIDFLIENPRRAEQAQAAGWDLLIVDEAHHLGWSEESASPAYRLVEGIGRKALGLLLLTATPEQLGLPSHYARLRLLDPDRYYDYHEFLLETAQYQAVARIADRLRRGEALRTDEEGMLRGIFPTASGRRRLEAAAAGREGAREELLSELLDRHGTGRVMFRNTRKAMPGFPRRIPHLAALPSTPAEPEWNQRMLAEMLNDLSSSGDDPMYDYTHDPRVVWLANLLRGLRGGKVLLICRSLEKAEGIYEALRTKINVNAAVFHESLPLIQRDRNAAWFSEADGAQLLICSEIGSEGRNFQFAHDLVLFDLPLDPEVLEQRIGRLDRIGQTTDIHIHVPYLPGTPQEFLVRWYHEGLNAFEKNLHGAHDIAERFTARLKAWLTGLGTGEEPEFDLAHFENFLIETKTLRQDLEERLELGRDHLLELNSFRPEEAARIARDIAAVDEDPRLEVFLLEMFEHMGIHVEEFGKKTFMLGGGDLVKEAFPSLPEKGLVVTTDRAQALKREDIGFLSWDHPVVTGALDHLLGSSKGTSSFGVWSDAAVNELLLEAVYLVETLAPARLHLDRYLPATPLRAVVNQSGEDCAEKYPFDRMQSKLKAAAVHPILEQEGVVDAILPGMLKRTGELVQDEFHRCQANALGAIERDYESEIGRLRSLKEINPNIRAEEIEAAEVEKKELLEKVRSARLRMDAVRLIVRGGRGMTESGSSKRG